MGKLTIKRLLDIGSALSREKDHDKLFEIILTAAMDISDCDGGTLYRKEENTLSFSLMFTRSLGIRRGGQYGQIPLPPVALSRKNVCALSALEGRLINLPDVYQSGDYDFSGPRQYDAMTGYRTASMLVVPMEDDRSNCIGVLQLINAMDENGTVIPFDSRLEPVIRSLASQTAICRMNMNYAEEIQDLMSSMVLMFSAAIDARTPYNANHTRNMVKLAVRFLDWLDATRHEWLFNQEDRRQFLLSIWLHDVGKLAIPLEVMNKPTRLGTAIAQIVDRFRVMTLLDRIAVMGGLITPAEAARRKEEYIAARKLIELANGVEYLTDSLFAGVRDLAGRTFLDEEGLVQPWLTPEEADCLSIRKGTLTPEEREIMEDHAVMTDKMLGDIKFPPYYGKVREWAGEHHEFLDGSGYPRGLDISGLARESRLMTIIDIFEALTAPDRPYRASISAEKGMSILWEMAGEGKLDKDILALFQESRAWEEAK